MDCRSALKPSRAPTPCTTMRSGREAVTRGSFWRSEPAAALRGLANGALPASTRPALSSRNATTGKKTSPRTSSRRGARAVGDLQRRRHVRDGADVQRDVLTGHPVAAGQRADQPAVLVEQVDGQPVHLELAQVVDVDSPGVALDPLGPGRQLGGRERVVQAHHPLDVVDGLELGGERATDGLGGRVRRAQLGMTLLDRLQLAHHRVVVAVADRRRVAHEVVEAVPVDLLGQLGVPVQVVGGCPSSSWWPLIPPGRRPAHVLRPGSVSAARAPAGDRPRPARRWGSPRRVSPQPRAARRAARAAATAGVRGRR